MHLLSVVSPPLFASPCFPASVDLCVRSVVACPRVSEYLQWSATLSKRSTVKCLFERMLCTDQSLSVHFTQVLEKRRKEVCLCTPGGRGREVANCSCHLMNHFVVFLKVAFIFVPKVIPPHAGSASKKQFVVQRYTTTKTQVKGDFFMPCKNIFHYICALFPLSSSSSAARRRACRRFRGEKVSGSLTAPPTVTCWFHSLGRGSPPRG